jgi:hypothetical protein
MNINNIAYSTANLIIKELFSAYDQGVEFTRKKIEKALTEEGVDREMIDKILLEVAQEDPFQKARNELENQRKRIRFIKQSFPHVEAETVVLGSGENSLKDNYQYVDIKASLKVLLEDEKYRKQRSDDNYAFDVNVIKDVRDGDCFQTNEFFQQNPEAVPILVFVDELEVCNPLGAGKVKHKLNCTYYSTLEIQPALRSKVQSIQLVSLIKSNVFKKYGTEKCNERFIKDLKQLEDIGIEITKPVPHIRKAGLAFMVGDNLGQHQISEMNQSFSSGHICRWCKVTYKKACKEGMCYWDKLDPTKPDEWTVQDYDQYAEIAKQEGNANEDTFGVKRHCTFNQLKSFHCVKQTAPCIGHDFFEGVMSYDLQFYLDYIIFKEKLLTQEEFNLKLKNVKLSSRDSKNRPKDFKKRKRNSKYEGNAGSIRVLGRVLPMILSDILGESEVGELVIKLEEVSELITAPKLTIYEIEDVLETTIAEYIQMRVEAVEAIGMDTIKPKHHFLLHYSKLYLYHGPLIHLWAMRMEAKHTFMKNCIRTSKNFINPAKTCANRHELAQISYRYDGLFPNKYDIPDNTVSVRDLKNMTSDSLMRQFMEQFESDVLIPVKITIHGTDYEPGMLLVIEKSDFGEIKVGVLKAIAFHENEVYFGCSVFISCLSINGYYVSVKNTGVFDIVKYSSLADHHPLHRVGTVDRFCFSLHHYLSNSFQE